MVLQSEDLWGLRLKVTLPRDTICVTNAESWVVFDVVGHLIEFLIDTDANFLVETQRIGDLSNHKGYVMGLSGKYKGTVSWRPFCATSMASCF